MILLTLLALLLVISPAYGQLSDATGLVQRLDVQTGGHTFEVHTVSNFDITNHTFDKDEKRLTLYISSSLENNLSEMVIPKNLLGGNLTFYLNGQEYHPKLSETTTISFATLIFTGSGDNKLDIVGTTYLDEIVLPDPKDDPIKVPIRDTQDYLVLYIILFVGIGTVGAVIFKLKRR